MGFWSNLNRNAEFNYPLLIAVPNLLVCWAKHFFPPVVAENFYEARQDFKPIGFTENVEEIILDELTSFVLQPDKDIMATKFSMERTPLNTKYRMMVTDDLQGVVVGYARFMVADYANVLVPRFVLYDTLDDVARDCDRLQITSPSSTFLHRLFFGRGRGRLEKIEWGSEIGVRLMKTLVLSNDAKRFLIQRLIQEADIVNTAFFETIVYGLPMFLAGGLNYGVKKFFDYRRSRMIRRPMLWPFYLTSTMIGVAGVIVARRFYREYIDLNADHLTSVMGETYTKGGVEYYQKMMERNRCVNELLQKAKSERFYEKDGDFIRHHFAKPFTSLKIRLQLVKDVAEKAAEKEKGQEQAIPK